MRILLISNIYPPSFIGGYELAARDVARALVARGHDVTVLAAPSLDGTADGDEPYPILRGLDWVSLSTQPMSAHARHIRGLYLNLRNLDALRAALLSVQPEVVLCFNLTGLGVLGLLRLLQAAGVPTLAFLMDNWFDGARQHPADFASFRRVFAVEADVFGPIRVIGCSRGLIAEVSHEIGAPLPAPEIIPAWVELDQLPDGAPVAADQARFLFTSRIAPHKGIDIVIAAAELLQTCGLCDFTIDLYGAGLVADAVQHSHARHVETLIRYQGPRSKAETLRLYHGYDALLAPTWPREPSGFVVFEAAASGCLPIMTATMGGAEFFLDGHDSIKIARTPESLAAAMHRVMAMPPADRLARRIRLRRHARRMFDATRHYDRLERLLQDLAAGDAPRQPPDGVTQAIAALAQLWSNALD